MNNSIIDLIIRIKNGYLAKKEHIESPYSSFQEEVLKKLVSLGFVKEYQVEVQNQKTKQLKIELLYEAGAPTFTDVKIYSTPGRRWYVSAKDLKPVLGGFGAAIVSTAKGVMTNSEAKKVNLGGELLFEIW